MKKIIYSLSILTLLCTQTLASAANSNVTLTINNYTENPLTYEYTKMFAGDIVSKIPVMIPPGNANNPSVITINFTSTLPIYPNACSESPTPDCVVLQQSYKDKTDQSSITITYSSQSGDPIYTNCEALGTPISHDICSVKWSPTNPVVDIRTN